MRTDSRPCADDHSSPDASPGQVPRMDRHTLPCAYIFGLNRQRPLFYSHREKLAVVRSIDTQICIVNLAILLSLRRMLNASERISEYTNCEEQASEHHRDIMIKRANSVNEYTWRYVL